MAVRRTCTIWGLYDDDVVLVLVVVVKVGAVVVVGEGCWGEVVAMVFVVVIVGMVMIGEGGCGGDNTCDNNKVMVLMITSGRDVNDDMPTSASDVQVWTGVRMTSVVLLAWWNK